MLGPFITKAQVPKEPVECPGCHRVRRMTRDHRIPRWFLVIIHNFALGWTIKTDPYNAPVVHMRRLYPLCAECNQKKGGRIDYADPEINAFMREFAKRILNKCDEHYIQRSVLQEQDKEMV